MPAPSPFAPFIEPLERLGIPYCITGSVAATALGRAFLDAQIARLGLEAEWRRCQP